MIQVKACCHQAPSHYLNQCCSSSTTHTASPDHKELTENQHGKAIEFEFEFAGYQKSAVTYVMGLMLRETRSMTAKRHVTFFTVTLPRFRPGDTHDFSCSFCIGNRRYVSTLVMLNFFWETWKYICNFYHFSTSVCTLLSCYPPAPNLWCLVRSTVQHELIKLCLQEAGQRSSGDQLTAGTSNPLSWKTKTCLSYIINTTTPHALVMQVARHQQPWYWPSYPGIFWFQ